MSNFTQQAITQAFLELLAERPMDKITVMDITRRCDINRNTFYYHFHDIYDLLDQILRAEEERLVELARDDLSNWQESVNEGTRWAMENQDAIYHIYKSVNRERLERYLFTTGETSARRFVETQAEGLSVPQQCIDDIVHVVAAAIAGLVLEWLNSGMKDDPREFVQRISGMMEGNIRATLERSARPTL